MYLEIDTEVHHPGSAGAGRKATQQGKAMESKVDEIAAVIYRLSTHVAEVAPPAGATIRRLADLAPRTLALMHGPSFGGDGRAALRALADDYDRRVRDAARAKVG
jgi:hypothetical protein